MRRKRTTALKLRDEGHNGHGGSVHIRGDLLDKCFGGGPSLDRAFGLQVRNDNRIEDTPKSTQITCV